MPAFSRILSAILAGIGLHLATPAQDILHYKFDGGCGSTAINYAAGSPAPATGTIVTGGAAAASWTSGRFGTALARGSAAALNHVDTGWTPPNLTGSVSWACWLRIGPNVTQPVLNGLVGTGTGGWWLVTNLLLTTGVAGASSFNATPLLSLARAGWTHVACVLDSNNRLMTYYLNGVAQTPVTVNSPLFWSATSNVLIGKALTYNNLLFDMDEFILANRVLSTAEIAVLASAPRAADGPFAMSAGPTLLGNGSLPVPGNLAYGLVVNVANVGLGLVLFGSNHCSMAGGTVSLPADLGLLHPALASVLGHVDSDLGTVFLGLPAGATPVPCPLPDLPGLVGYSFFAQALTFDAPTSTFAGSNAVAIGIGR